MVKGFAEAQTDLKGEGREGVDRGVNRGRQLSGREGRSRLGWKVKGERKAEVREGG